MKKKTILQRHFPGWDEEDALDRVLSFVMFWPLLPMTLAKGCDWPLRVGAMVAFPMLYIVNIPFMILILFPALMAVVAREMWREMSK